MGKRILIVDDEPDLIKIFQVRLKKNNYESCSAENGKEALDWVKQDNVGLAFIDYFLPDTNGLELSKAIRATHGHEELPIIFISASAEKIDEIPSLEKTEKFVKPLTPEKMLELVQKYL